MTHERKVSYLPSTFPLSELALRESVAWLLPFRANARENIEQEKLRLSGSDPHLRLYFDGMHEMRSRQFHYPQMDGVDYQTGFFYGMELIKRQYEGKGTQPPKVKKAANAYFRTLLVGIEDGRTPATDKNYRLLSLRTPHADKTYITPMVVNKVYDTYAKGCTEYEELPVDIKEIVNNFTMNSKCRKNEMFIQEKGLYRVSTVFQDLLGTTGAEHFSNGLADCYWPFQMHEVIGPYAQILDEQRF